MVELVLQQERTPAVDLKKYIRDVPDRPKPGIVFKDITPLLGNPVAFSFAIRQLAMRWAGEADAIAALDARGFLFGGALIREMHLPLAPIRKKGKLPWQTESQTYQLEYGTDTVEIHVDAFDKGARVLVLDDLLATGGTADAACQLVERVGGTVVGCAFVVEVLGLGGRELLESNDRLVHSLIQFDNEAELEAA